MKLPSRRTPSSTDGPSRRALVPAATIAAGVAVIGIGALISSWPTVGPFGGSDTGAQVSPTNASNYQVQDSPAPPALDPAQERRQAGRQPGRLWSGSGFRLASVREGQRVGVFDHPRGTLVDRVGARTEFGSLRVFSVIRRRGDWLRVTTPIAADNQDLWIRADPARLSFGTTNISLRVNLVNRMVEVYRGDRVIHSFTVTIGATGTSTPAGRFQVTDMIVGGLSPAYGCCAAALSAHQTSLAPGWIGGDRIAIHGTIGPVGEAVSNGCLRATNADAEFLVRTVPLGAPVFITT